MPCGGLCGPVAVSKARPRRGNNGKHLSSAKKYQNFTVDDWKSPITGESKLELYNSNRRVYVRRLMGEQHSLSNLQVNMMGIFKSGGCLLWNWTPAQNIHAAPSSFHLCGEGAQALTEQLERRPRTPDCHWLSSTVNLFQPHWTFIGNLKTKNVSHHISVIGG